MIWRGKLNQLLVFGDYKGTGDRNENGHKVIWLNGLSSFPQLRGSSGLEVYGDG